MQPRKPITDDELIIRINKLLNVERRQIESEDYLLYAPNEKVINGYVEQMITLCDEAKAAIVKVSGDRGSAEYALAIDKFMFELRQKLEGVRFDTDSRRLLHEISQSVNAMKDQKKKMDVETRIVSLKHDAEKTRSLHSLEAYANLHLHHPKVSGRVRLRAEYVQEEDAAQAKRDAAIATPAPVKKSGFLRGWFGSSKPKPTDPEQAQELGSVGPRHRRGSSEDK